jgi:PAS domain S-box-containing protein
MKKNQHKDLFNERIRKYRVLFDLAPVGIAIVDSERRIVESNDALEKIARITKTGLESGFYWNRKYIDKCGKELLPDEFPSSIALREKRTVTDVEIGILEADEVFWTEVSAAPLDASGKFAVVITRDITDRKDLETQKTASEEKYRSFFENSMDAVLLTGTDGKIYSANQAACNMFGTSEQEICRAGRNGVIDLTDPRLSDAIIERRTRGKALRELTLVRHNGTTFPAEISSSVFTNVDGIQMTSMIIRDITERKKGEKELFLQSEILKNISEGINLIRAEGETIVFTNQKFDEIFGYNHGELIGKHVTILNAPAYKKPDEIKNDIVNSITKTGEWHGEIQNIKKSGDHFWCYVNVSKFNHPDFGEVFLSVHTDITDRKLAEKTLSESEAAFRSIFENSVMGISQAHPGGKLIRINQAYAEMYGYCDTSTMLREISDNTTKLYVNPSDRAKVIDILDKRGSMTPVEFELKRRNGEHFWALVGAKQVRDDSGELLYLQAEHIDITELKNIQNALRESEEKHRLIMENSGLGIAYYSVNGEILMLNQVALKNFGGKASDYLGKNLTDVFGNEAGKRFIDRLKLAAESESPLIFKDYIELEGKPGWYLSTQSRILNQNGDVDGIQVIADNITELKVAENKLKESQNKYRNLTRHLNRIMENERSTIAMNLHDDLGQKLTALNLGFAWIRARIGVQSSLCKKKMDEMGLLINEIIISIQELSSFLKPSMLSDLGLYPAVSSLLEKFEKQSGIRCHFQHGTDETKIDENISLVVYRILQESLTNIARHSGATVAEVKISRFKSKIELVIMDNGKGIEREQVISPTSMGMMGIKERVKSVKGKLKIKGGTEFGTAIWISIPLIQFNDD